jgi:peptidoglycan hydrolase-like protein with peptidoglycan-binding domain
MGRGVVLAVVALALAPAAQAACPVKVSKASGAAPLRVTFRATCASTVYRWRFGDGARADGRAVTHAFRGGRFAPVLVTDAGKQKVPAVTSIALTLLAPRQARYGDRVTLRARVVPKLPVKLGGAPFRGGRLSLTVTQPFLTAVAGGVAARTTIAVVPRLDVRIEGDRTVGAPLRVVAAVRPAHAGTLHVDVDGASTTAIDTSAVRASRIVVSTKPRRGWAAATRVVHAHVHAPTLSLGARGNAVVALEERLADLRYAIRDRGGVYDDDDWQAVLAFQKVNGLPATGTVTPELWSRLSAATAPRAREGGDYVEVDKTRQVLFVVRDGKVELATHVSTGATGNTPVGTWRVYRKVVGWSWVLWYPSYFLRGFAIHGYPEVPAYPASHGCVRVPMWLAPRLFTQIPAGGTVRVYA